MAVDEDDGGRSRATLICEACGLQCKVPRDLAVHLERHRPVDPPTFDPDTGKKISYPCPEGCGRNFIVLTRFRDHVPSCDGEPPLEPFLKVIPTGFLEGFVICPECKAPFKDIDKMAFHLERHREVVAETRHRRTGKVLSKPCPRKCGRHFSHWKEYEEHVKLCDGKQPLPTNGQIKVAQMRAYANGLRRKKEMERMMRCQTCDRDFTKAGPYSIHMRAIHGKDYAPSIKKTRKSGDSEEDEQGRGSLPVGSNGSTLSELRDKSRELRRTADRIEEIAQEIEKLSEEAEKLI